MFFYVDKAKDKRHAKIRQVWGYIKSRENISKSKQTLGKRGGKNFYKYVDSVLTSYKTIPLQNINQTISVFSLKTILPLENFEIYSFKGLRSFQLFF